MKAAKNNLKGDTFSGMFQFQSGIYDNAQVDLTEEVALKKASQNSNTINWLLGHILHCRFMLAKMIGVKVENPFGETYWGPLQDKKYPKVKEVVSHFPAVSKKLTSRISSMTNEELDARPAEGQPSLADIISFFAYHEAYHLGQIGFARRAIGLEAMKSN